jgi:hypothetical protein
VTDGGHPVVWFAGEVAGQGPDLRAWWRRMLVLQGRSLAHVLALTGRGAVVTGRHCDPSTSS